MDGGEESAELLTVKETAVLLNVSEVTIKRYVSQDLLNSVKIAGSRRILRQSLENLISEKENKKEKTFRGVHFYW